MGEHIFLAREFFDEEDIQNLLASPNISTVQRIRDISLERGIILSKDSDQESLIRDTAIVPFDWERLNGLTRYLDKEIQSSLPRTVRISGVASLTKIEDILDAYKKKVEKKVVETTLKPSDDGFGTIKNTYIERKPGLLKGLQREKIPTEIRVSEKNGIIEINHGKDDKSEELAALLVATIRELPNAEEQIIQEEVSLESVRSAELKTKFFMDLILGVPELAFVSSPKVRIHKADEDSDLDDLEDEAEDEEEKKSRKLTEKSVAGKIESASLRGDNVLLTKLYKELANDGYYIGSLVWEAVEKGGDRRKIIIEISFSQPSSGKGFCVDIKGVYDKDLNGDFKLVPRISRKSECDALSRKVMNAAYVVCRKILKELPK